MDTRSLLAAAKAAQGITTNAALARALDVPEKYVQRWNTGKHTPDDLNAAKLADMAGVDPFEAVASVAAERAAAGPARELWQRIAQRLHAAGATAAAVILSLWIGGGPDGAAMASTPVASNGAHLSITQSTFYTLARLAAWIRHVLTVCDRRCTGPVRPLFCPAGAA